MKKRLTAIVVAVVMVLSMSVTALGGPPGDGGGPPCEPDPLSICISDIFGPPGDGGGPPCEPDPLSI